MARMPTRRAPTHPGEMLALEFLAPLGMTQVELAERIGVPFQRVNHIIRGKRAVTPDMALRLARLFGTTPEFWLNLQQTWDLYEAVHSPNAPDIAAIEPVKKAG
jgi:addiction module HigA family antidote